MEKMPHILLAKQDACKYALLPGDPARLDRIATHMEQVQELAYNREFRSIKGFYQGVEIIAVSTGIGGPSTAIVVEELHQLGVENMIRIGSCGALQKHMHVGDIVLVSGAIRDDGTSKTYVDTAYPAVADFSLLQACQESALDRAVPHHIGIARSHDSFYIDDKKDIYDFWKSKGVLASDMETAALYVVGGLRGIRCASILNVVVASDDELQEQINHYTQGVNLSAAGERNEILTALDAFVRIEKKHVKERYL